MKKVLRKEFRREVKNSFQRFLSILLISALGVAFFAGLRTCKSDMLLTADAFYDETELMDLRIVSDKGLTLSDVEAVQGCADVFKAQGAITGDVLIYSESKAEDLAVRIHMLGDINTCRVLSGRMPENETECVADTLFLRSGGYQVGDTVTLGEELVFDASWSTPLLDTLNSRQYKIVGEVSTGRYMSSARGTSSIGSGKISGYLMLPQAAYHSQLYNEIYVVFHGTKPLNGHDAVYEKAVSAGKLQIEAIQDEQCSMRLKELQDTANKELDEVYSSVAEKEELLNGAAMKFYRTQKEITDGYAAIQAGRDEIAEKTENLPEQFAEAEKQLKEAGKKLEKAREKLQPEAAEVEAARAEYDDYVKRLQDISQGPEDIRKILALLGIYVEDIEAAEAELAQKYAALEEEEAEYEKQVIELSLQKEQAEEELIRAAEELDAKEAELVSTEELLKSVKAEHYATLSENKKKIADAYAQINEKRAEIAAWETPNWYLLDRNTIESYVSFEQDADRMDAISKVFPAIFFLVAALVSLTTMTRMVDEERTQIGTMKALGYRRSTIVGKYMKYALYATLIGSAFGVAVGSMLFPYIIITTYKLVYAYLPGVVLKLHPYYSSLAAGLAVCCTLLATYAACQVSLREQPAALMRPVAPKAGKKILLERIGFLWKHLSFTRKATLRNLFRYKKRFFMTVVGIGGCMALLLVGFGIKDSIGVMSHIQYGELWQYDASVSFRTGTTQEEREETLEQLKADRALSDAVFVYEKAMDLSYGDKVKQVNVLIMPEASDFERYFSFRDRESLETYSMRDGEIILTEKLAGMLGVKEKDTVELKQDTTSAFPVRIAAVTENYIYHYAFMTEQTYVSMFGEPPVYNNCYVLFHPNNTLSEEEVAEGILKCYDKVASISVTSTMQGRIDDMLKSLNVITYVLIVCAGMLAFIVLYNLSNINITERKRELATLKVLGFYDGEVSRYVYRENVLLTILGILLGIGIGRILHDFVITTCEVDMVMFGHLIEPDSYVYSTVLTILFALLIGLMMHFRLKKIDMIESLKCAE